MTIELPKDAEGREIPLDVEFLYSASGEPVKPYSFTFRRYDGFCWEMHLVGAPNLVYDPESFYLTPSDSWEKLEDDLGRVASCGESSTPACTYTRQPCAVCRFHSSEDCTSAMCADILNRIRKLRGED